MNPYSGQSLKQHTPQPREHSVIEAEVAGFSHANFSPMEKTMNTVQLPNFKNHPECAAGVITLDQAAMMIERGWLTYDGARFLLPPRAWPYLPKPAPQSAQTEQPKRLGLIHSIKNWRKQYV
jgi:hypothetical protein